MKTLACKNEILQKYIFSSTEIVYLITLYLMVTQNILRSHEGKNSKLELGHKSLV